MKLFYKTKTLNLITVRNRIWWRYQVSWENENKEFVKWISSKTSYYVNGFNVVVNSIAKP